MQAAKILANLIVMGGGILARAVVQAYRQALTSKLYKSFLYKFEIRCVKYRCLLIYYYILRFLGIYDRFHFVFTSQCQFDCDFRSSKLDVKVTHSDTVGL